MFGAARSRDPARERGVIETFLAPMSSLPFDDVAADRYAGRRLTLERQGMRIGAYDLQIAAIALCQGLTLVTHNTQEFSRVIEGIAGYCVTPRPAGAPSSNAVPHSTRVTTGAVQGTGFGQ